MAEGKVGEGKTKEKVVWWKTKEKIREDQVLRRKETERRRKEA